MGIRIFLILGLLSIFPALTACESSVYKSSSAGNVDSISRNVNQTAGGTISGPLQQAQPPIRPQYATER